MRVHVLKQIRVDRLGTLRPGAVVDLHPSVASTFLRQAAVELVETKEARQTPLSAAGMSLSVSPAAQASPAKTSKKSASGGKTPSKSKSGAS